MKIVPFAVAVVALASLAVAPALAQEAPSVDNGRYQLMEGAIAKGAAGDSRVTLMIDTQAGRTWMLVPSAEFGGQWVRLPLVRMDKAPEGMLTRPLPVQR